jgi:Tol biopolymer transport system component
MKRAFPALILSLSFSLFSGCGNIPELNNAGISNNSEQFEIKQLSSGYEKRKLSAFLLNGDGQKLVKELSFEMSKEPDLLHDIFSQDQTFLENVIANTTVSQRMANVPAFNTFMNSLKVQVQASPHIVYGVYDWPNGSQNYLIKSDGSGSPFNFSANLQIFNNINSISNDGKKVLISSFYQSPQGDLSSLNAYLVNTDGTGSPVNFTNDRFSDFFFPGEFDFSVFSPDDSQIFLAGRKAGENKTNIYIVNTNGTGNPVSLTNNLSGSFSPKGWTKDGKYFIFNVWGSSNTFYSVNMNTMAQNQLGNSSSFTYSPILGVPFNSDSTKVFVTANPNDSGSSNILLMNLDGTGAENITNGFSAGFYENTSLSPDGQKLAFTTSVNNDGVKNLYIMNSNGAGTPQNLSTGLFASNVSWSLNGFTPGNDRIVFGIYDPDTNTSALYSIKADGTGDLKNLTSDAPGSYNEFRGFSRDGQKILFQTGIQTNGGPPVNDIYVMNLDGSDKVRITNTASVNESEARWTN